MSTRSSKICSAESPRSSASGWSIIAWSFTASRSTASTDLSLPSSRARAAARGGGLVLLFLACVGPHLVSKLVFGRSRWPRRFLGAAARICGCRVSVSGTKPSAHCLIVANHLSWLDILILGGATGCAFVSKDRLGHGMIHWLADQNHTIYVSRADRRGSKGQALVIARALEREKPVAIFPEGTTGPGSHLLPFRSTLLEAVAYAGRDVTVRPVAIDYGAARYAVAWHGESGMDNVLRILGRRGNIDVNVHILPALERSGDRKLLARQAREAIDESLAST